MSTYLRKCIDIAPSALTRAPDFVFNDYTVIRDQWWWKERMRHTTSHIRLAADWPSLQHSTGPPGTDERDRVPLARLDAEVDAALADGLKIILMPYRYPAWANDTVGMPSRSVEDGHFIPWDRHARLAQFRLWEAGQRPTQAWKELVYRMPADGHGPASNWGRYVEWLWDRYAAHVEIFEVTNEPNLQLWPQRTTISTDDFDARWGIEGTSLLSTPAVAEMIMTVDALARRRPGPATLLAPSCADSDIDDVPRSTTISHYNPYADTTDPFADSLLAHLDRLGFVADDRWVWSYHNYADMERRQDHVVYLRRLLAERGWKGRRLDGGPELWSTEGGCRLNQTNTRFSGVLGHTLTTEERKDYQARVITEALSRHHHPKGIGAGIGMITQYTTWADPGFDTGVLDAASAGGAVRPSLAAWCDVPEYVAAPVQRAAWRPQP